eukprot:ANDGO_00297.mRNA.1 hypothetical protein
MSDKKSEMETKVSEIEAYVPKCMGPSCKWKIEIEWDSFDQAGDKERALDFFTNWTGYYSLEPLKNAIYQLSAWEDDIIVDAVAEGIEKIKFYLEPGTDTDKKKYEFEDKKLKLYAVYEAREWKGVFDTAELRSLLVECGLSAKPELKVELLASVASNYWTRWGWTSSLKKMTDNEGMFAQPDEKLVKAVNDKGYEGSYIKLYNNLLKVNKRGKKQKRGLLITTSKFYTFEIKGDGIKEDSWQPHNYGDIICIDIYNAGGALSKEWAMIAYTNEEKPKKPSFFDKFKGKLPGVKLPGIPLPSINAPSVNLPSVDLPSVNLPSIDLPKISLPDLPDVDISNPFKRHKEEPPKRYHPATKDKRFFNFVAENGSGDEKTLLAQEVGWVFYAGYANGTRRTDYLPFYLDKKQVFDQGTEIKEAKRPRA